MALIASPRKVIPLSTGDDWDPSSSRNAGPLLTRRAFFCGVVVEDLRSREVKELLSTLGDPLSSETEGILSRSSPGRQRSGSFPTPPAQRPTRKRANTNSSALRDVITELVTTEASYVRRLQILKNDYADPLRTFARSRDTAIIPVYEAMTIFGNIDKLLPVNEAFLADLQNLPPDGKGIGDVALKHFRDSRGFEQYRTYYSNRNEAQTMFESEMKKKNSGFSNYVDRIKYQSADMRNRVGLRELLMDPVQRIPRYTLLFRNMIKYMAPADPERAKLEEADEIASAIAQAEADENTKTASAIATLYSNIEGFPPELYSHTRKFVDWVDVEGTSSLSHTHERSEDSLSGGSRETLHGTLFLFDDKLLFVKRPEGEKGGEKALAGLDGDKTLLPLGKKKNKLLSKFVVEVTDVVATDVGGSDMHIYLENVPSDRWWGRGAFRALTVVNPPNPPNLNPSVTEAAKKRFVENLWAVQAKYRTKDQKSVALVGEEGIAGEPQGAKVTRARVYYNIYERANFLNASKKTKVVLHIDDRGDADPIPFGLGGGPPLVVIRVQPVPGESCHWTVTSSDLDDPGEETCVETSCVATRIRHTIHLYGLFKFRTGPNSVPSTPTTTQRSKAGIFSLDAVARNFFNVRPGTKTTDIFGSGMGNRRQKPSGTVMSRTSTITATTATADSSMMKSMSSANSTTTAATTVSSGEEEAYNLPKPARSRRKLTKRGKSPSSEFERPGSSLSIASSRSRSRSTDRELEYSDPDEEVFPSRRNTAVPRNKSEHELSMRLELARHNSQIQNGTLLDATYDEPVEESIYDQDPPRSYRPLSRASMEVPSLLSTAATVRPGSAASVHPPPSPSLLTPERRPLGPRSPSSCEDSPPPSPPDLPESDAESVFEATLVDTPQALTTPAQLTGRTSPLPRSKRMPFEPMKNLDNTPKPSIDLRQKLRSQIEPLSIRKKTSVRSSAVLSLSGRYGLGAGPSTSPLFQSTTAQAEPDDASTSPRHRMNRRMMRYDETESLTLLAATTKEDLEGSHRAVKKLKLEVERLRSSLPATTEDRPQTREAQARMQEMRAVIAKRTAGDGFGRNRARSLVDASSPRQHERSSSTDIARSIEKSMSDLEKQLAEAIANQDALCQKLNQLKLNVKEDATEYDQLQNERRACERQIEAFRDLYDNISKEKDCMYESFNEELGTYAESMALSQDSTLVWMQMTEERSRLERENMQLKWRLAQEEAEKEEWGKILRSHGLIP